MSGSMVEGISTSLQHCPPTSDPCDLQGLEAPESSSFSSQLCVHDPGLTLSPGPQRERADDLSCLSELPGTSQSSQVRTDDSSDETGKVDIDRVMRYGTTNSDRFPTHDDFLTPAEGFLPGDGDIESATIPDPDSIFESEFDLENLEALFYNRKRSPDGGTADFDVGQPADKRPRMEAPADESNGPFERTPSLSSPGSSRVTQPSETVLNTPAHIERLQTPDSLFDPQEPLIAGEELFCAWEGDDPVPEKAVAHQFELDDSELALDIREIDVTRSDWPGHPSPPAAEGPPTISQATKQKFSLDAQDLLAASMREVLHRPDKAPEYSSPYPRAVGPVGYLPSAPVLHIRFIEATEEKSRKRIAKCVADVKRLTDERDKYRRAWMHASTFDPATGKAWDRVHKEEISKLKRECTSQQRMADCFKWDAERFKFQADNWQGAYQNLAITYNRLLSDYQQLHRMMTVPPQPSMGTSQPGVPTPGTLNVPVVSHPPSVQAPNAAQSASPVTIDLTDGPAEPDSCSSPPPPVTNRDGAQLLEKLRKKNYAWLDDDGRAGGVSTRVSPQSTSSQGAQMPLSDEDELARMMEEELAQG